MRLASGENLMDNLESKNEVQVIKLWPATSVQADLTRVSDNCRLCLWQRPVCLPATWRGDHRRVPFPLHQLKALQRGGMCAQNCPYGAIVHLVRPCKKACPVDAITYDEYGICVIDEDKCIECGRCIHSCPFGAISAKSYLVKVIEEIKAGKEVIAMCAPATEGQYGEKVGMGSIRNALKKMGFADMVEVGLAMDRTGGLRGT